MANALCTQCGKKFRYPSRRGTRLSDYVSPCCNAPGKGGGERVKLAYQSVLCEHQEQMGWLSKNWYTGKHKLRFGYAHGGLVLCKQDRIYYPCSDCDGEWLEFWEGVRPDDSPKQYGYNAIRIKRTDWEKVQRCQQYAERIWNRGEYQAVI